MGGKRRGDIRTGKRPENQNAHGGEVAKADAPTMPIDAFKEVLQETIDKTVDLMRDGQFSACKFIIEFVQKHAPPEDPGEGLPDTAKGRKLLADERARQSDSGAVQSSGVARPS